MKKNQKGISLVLLILIVLIVIVGVFIYGSISNKQTNLAEEQYNYEPISNKENEAIGYYYNQLPNPSKIMYNTILGNIDKLKSGTEKIEFPDSVGDSIKEINGNIEENKGDLYWTLNIQPNYIENGTKFIYKLVTKLLIDKTALVLINQTARRNLL